MCGAGYVIGAADFLTKPFDPWLLRTKVNVFLELYRKNRQLAVQAEQLRQLLLDEGSPAGLGRLDGSTAAWVTLGTPTDATFMTVFPKRRARERRC